MRIELSKTMLDEDRIVIKDGHRKLYEFVQEEGILFGYDYA